MKIKLLSAALFVGACHGLPAQEIVAVAELANTIVTRQDSIVVVSTFDKQISFVSTKNVIVVTTDILPFLVGQSSTGTRDLKSIEGLLIYPNPVAEMLIITRDASDDKLSVRLYQSDGTLLTNKLWAQGEQMRLSLNGLASGVYVVAVTNADETRGSQFKVVKQ